MSDLLIAEPASKPAAASFADRAAGAIVGALIGDALGVGPHWYYDLEAQRRDYGESIDGYTTPRDDRYHAGLAAGEPSQTGIITRLLLDSILHSKGYDPADFTKRFDRDIFARIDGTPDNGPGGFTHKSVRAAFARRTRDKADWGALAGNADNTEAAERILPIAILHARDGARGVADAIDNSRLLQGDPTILVATATFAAVIGALVRGIPLDADIGSAIDPALDANAERLPELATLRASRSIPAASARLVDNAAVTIEPAHAVASVFGLSCAASFVLPGAYYLASRFRDDFTAAVLHALNGGGQNLGRAYLVGALVGAQVGLSGIPQRFIEGLADRDAAVASARRLAQLAA